MSSLNSGYEVVVRLQVDRSGPDAAIAELQRGVTVPVRYVAEGPGAGATSATSSPPTSSPTAEPVTFGTPIPAGAPGATPLFTPAPSAASHVAPAGAFADSLRQPIPVRLDFDPARAELRRFAEEMRSLLPVIAPTAPARLGGEQFALGTPYSVAGQNLNGGSIRSNAGTLNVVRGSESARPAVEAAPSSTPGASRTVTGQPATPAGATVYRGLYHGTAAQTPFTQFDTSRESQWSAYGPGAYFARQRERSEEFATGHMYRADVAIENPYDVDKPLPTGSRGRYNAAAQSVGLRGLPEDVDETNADRVYRALHTANRQSGADVRRILEAAGHGGISAGGDVVAWKPEQVAVRSVESTAAEYAARQAHVAVQESRVAPLDVGDFESDVTGPVAQPAPQPIHAPRPVEAPSVPHYKQFEQNLAKAPDFAREEIERNYATAERAGVVQQIADLSVKDRLVAAQVRDRLGAAIPVTEDVSALDVVRSTRAKLGIPSQEDRTEFEAFRQRYVGESPAPVAETSGVAGGPPRRPPSALASGTSGDEGEPLRRPIPVTLDLSQARQQIEQLAAEAASRMRSVLLGVTPGPAGAGAATSGVSRVTSSAAETPEELYRRESAVVGQATQHAVDYAKRTGSFPTAGQLRRRFPDLQSAEAVQDVLGEARGQRQDERSLQRQRYRQDTADFSDFRGQQRAEQRATRQRERTSFTDFRRQADALYRQQQSQGQAEEEEEAGGGESPTSTARRPAGRGRSLLGRYLGPAYVAHEVLGVLQSEREYRDASGLATGADDHLRAELGLAQKVFRVPIVGQALDLATENIQFGIHRTVADAERQDRRTALYAQQQEPQIALRDRADAAAERGPGREALLLEQLRRSEYRQARNRAADRSEANRQEAEAAQSGIAHDHSFGAVPYVGTILRYTPFGATIGLADKLGVLPGLPGRQSALDSQRRIADARAAANAAQEGRDKAEADRLQREAEQEERERRVRESSGYQIGAARARAEARQFPQQANIEVFKDETRRQASQILQDSGQAAAATYLGQRSAQLTGIRADQARQTQVSQTQLAGTARQSILLAANDPFGANLAGIASQTQASLQSNRNPLLVAPIVAAGVAQGIQAYAVAGRAFFQERQQQGFQIRQGEASLRFDPLGAQVEGINAQRQAALAANNAAQIPNLLKPILANGINTVFDLQTKQARQNFAVQGAFERFGIQSEIEQLNLTIDGPGSPELRGEIARSRGIRRSTQEREARVIAEGHPELVPEVQKLGIRQEEGLRAEFIRSFRPEEISLNRTDLSGRGSNDPTQFLREIDANITAIRQEAAKGSGSASPAQQILNLLRQIIVQ